MRITFAVAGLLIVAAIVIATASRAAAGALIPIVMPAKAGIQLLPGPPLSRG
jgi:hypothetical protein